jgi:hypothetical protein
LGRIGKAVGAQVGSGKFLPTHQLRPRIIERKSRPGFHHPAGKQAIGEILESVGPVAFYGLRSIELVRAPDNAVTSVPLFGRYCVPGRIILYEQPMPPWRLSGLLSEAAARQLGQAGALLTRLTDVGATLVDWPQDTLGRFMSEHVLLHELGHHVMQHHKGKRPARIARTRDHEAFAARFAEKQRAALMKGRGH